MTSPPAGEYMPAVGKMFNCMENMMMRTIPVKKTGMLTPARAANMLNVSKMEYCLTAEVIPAMTPINTARERLAKVRIIVALNRNQISGKTSLPKTTERPKSNRTTFDIQAKYCTTKERSSPNS